MRRPCLQINQQLRVAQSSRETDHILGALTLSWMARCFPARGMCELLRCDVDEDGCEAKAKLTRSSSFHIKIYGPQPGGKLQRVPWLRHQASLCKLIAPPHLCMDRPPVGPSFVSYLS